jgi:hypothetical protein
MSYTTSVNTQNQLLLNHLMDYYKDSEKLKCMTNIINGESKISLRIVDWFVTNYAKKYFTVYEIVNELSNNKSRFKVYHDYKLKLKAYSKKRFDPFCRWERISIPYDEQRYMETTIGQLNFFKWALQHDIIKYIEENYDEIENDMNNRNSTSKRRSPVNNEGRTDNAKTRKKREELSVSACKCIKKETVEIVVKFN